MVWIRVNLQSILANTDKLTHYHPMKTYGDKDMVDNGPDNGLVPDGTNH